MSDEEECRCKACALDRCRLREQVERMDAEESAEADRQAALLLDALDRAARAETERDRLRRELGALRDGMHARASMTERDVARIDAILRGES